MNIMSALELLLLLLDDFFGLVETPDGEIIDNLLHLLEVILDTVKFLSKCVILQI